MLIENITLLREAFPEIRKYFLDHEKDLLTERIKVVESKSHILTACYQYDLEENELMVHSAYNPKIEAERIIKSHAEQLTPDTHVFFYGIGLGYHIEAFKDQYPELTYSLYEPIAEMFQVMTSEKKLNSLFGRKMKELYVDKVDEPDLRYLDEFQVENRKIHIIILPSYENILKTKKNDFLRFVKDTVQNRRSNMHAEATFQKLWVMNSIQNFSEVLSTPNIMRDIEKKHFKDKPAVIVSAGPSLAEDIEHIRYIKDNNLAYVFSVGSAINSLLSYDIFPDAVFTYDPGLKNHLVFEKMFEKGIDSIPMIFGSSVGYETLKLYKGPKAHFVTTQDRTSAYFLKDQLDMEQDLILDSPSIAVMTFQILNKLGVNPIIFAGQNLGYLYGRQYSKGIEYKHIDSKVEQEKLDEALTTKDVYGNEIKTNYGFNIMRASIESFADFYSGNTFFNTTKGGAAIEGVPFKPIEEVIEEVLTIKHEKSNWWVAENQFEIDNIGKRRNDLEKNKAALNLVIEKLPEVHKSLSNSVKMKNKKEVEKALVQFDSLYNSMLDNGFYTDFLSYYLRVFVKYMGNEITRLNREDDVFKKAARIEVLLANFIEQLKQGIQELDGLFGLNNLIATS